MHGGVISLHIEKITCITYLKKPQAMNTLRGVITFDCDDHFFQAFLFSTGSKTISNLINSLGNHDVTQVFSQGLKNYITIKINDAAN
jgi:hypothetical protein